MRSIATLIPRRRARPRSPCSIICSAAPSPGLPRCCASPLRKPGLRVTPKGPRCTLKRSRRCPPPGATMRSPRNGARCGPCAASSPARSRSSAPTSASAPRWRPRPSCTCPMRTCSRPCSMSILPRSRSRQRRRWSRAKALLRRFASPRSAASRWCRVWPRAPNARARGKFWPQSAPIRNIPMSVRATHRRCANGTRWPRRPSDVPHLYGPLTRLGLITAVVIGALDQAVKFWLMVVFQIGDRGVVHLTPFLDLVLTWNRGISYGLFQQEGDLGRYVLLALVIGAVIALCIWLASADSRLLAVSLGLIIGGAVGNAVDRLHWPGVMDFVLFHITTPTFDFTWYVFNLADSAIVAGVVGLLYESFIGGGVPQKRPDPH